MKFRPTTAASLVADLERFADWIANQGPEDRDWRDRQAAVLNRWLDRLRSEDTFGTEGQCDPRGDHRE